MINIKMSSLCEAIDKMLQPILQSKGLMLVDVSVKGLGRRKLIDIAIDGLTDNVTIGECEEVSRLLSVELDASNLFSGAFVLEVSSPGLDRTIKTDRELAWASSKKKRIKLFTKDGEIFEGIIKEFSEKKVKILEGGNEFDFSRENINRIKINEV